MLKPEWPEAKRDGVVGTSDRSCSLVGEGSAHLELSLHAGQAFSESRPLRMSVICPGQGCRESVQLVTGQFPVAQVSSPRRGPAGDRCKSSYECALPFLSYHLSCDVACLPAVWRAQALPWGWSTLARPSGALASQERGTGLPTVWSFSAFSLGRGRMKGQEEGGLRPRKQARCPCPAGFLLAHLASC